MCCTPVEGGATPMASMGATYAWHLTCLVGALLFSVTKNASCVFLG